MYAKIFKDSAASVKAWATRGKAPVKVDGLGILRKDMPQIRSSDMDEFFRFAKSESVEVSDGSERPRDLKPSQDEYSADQVSQLPESALRKRILVSSDGYVLDGHNRWARLLRDDPNQGVLVARIALPVRRALALMHKFPKSFSKSVDDVGATKSK